jgi:purine nucleosidase
MLLAFSLKIQLLAVSCMALLVGQLAAQTESSHQPIPLIFDTDIGNDCDDVLALAMIHALQSRGECELKAVTLTKDNPQAAAFVDAVNTFYGRPDIPIGVCRSGITPEAGKFNLLANAKDGGKLRYPHDLDSGDSAADAVSVLRKTLAAAANRSVAIAQVGFSTNLAKLLESPADSLSPLTGVELVKQKVRVVSIMAGAFKLIPDKGKMVEHREYNVIMNIPAAQKLVERCPVPVVWSGFEIGLALPYPHQSILNDFRYVEHHPVAEAYVLYMPPPHDRPTWDLTSVLYAIRPDHNYFDLSAAGKVQVADDGLTTFVPDVDGRDRYLVLGEQQKARIVEALRLLSSQPPTVR